MASGYDLPPMFGERITYRVHAVQRMFQRGIEHVAVSEVLLEGEVIESYPDDLPYPSRLMLGFPGSAPLHIVAVYNDTDDQTIVVTVYRPDPSRWSADFRVRRSP